MVNKGKDHAYFYCYSPVQFSAFLLSLFCFMFPNSKPWGFQGSKTEFLLANIFLYPHSWLGCFFHCSRNSYGPVNQPGRDEYRKQRLGEMVVRSEECIEFKQS